jgi:TRAP-type C4-dicarboxylate transport system substrate-binding protein
MKRSRIIALAFLFIFLPSHAVFAQRGGRAGETIEVRFASALPRNSDWGRGLDRIAAEWARVTNNEVRLRVIHDGLEGSELKMLSSLASNNIQAGLFSSAGISEICPAVMTLSIPFLIKNDAEFDLVLKETLPMLDAQLSRTNFVVITWSKGGWVSVFSKEPVIVPDDLRRQRLATGPELKDMNLAFRTMGFHTVETDIVDVGTRLANNMINAIYMIPAAIAPMGLHRHLNNMLDMPIAPVLGGIVVNRDTWNRIRPEHQRELIRVTQRIGTEFDAAMPRTESSAVSSMRGHGLAVNKPNQAQEALWRAEIDRALPSLLGTVFDRDLYQRINEILVRSRGGR